MQIHGSSSALRDGCGPLALLHVMAVDCSPLANELLIKELVVNGRATLAETAVPVAKELEQMQDLPNML